MNHFVLKGFFDFKITKVALVGLVLASLAEMVLQSYTGCIKYEGAGVLFVKKIDDNLGWQLFFSFYLFEHNLAIFLNYPGIFCTAHLNKVISFFEQKLFFIKVQFDFFFQRILHKKSVYFRGGFRGFCFSSMCFITAFYNQLWNQNLLI